MKDSIIRKEIFGGILLDVNNLSHHYLNKQEYDSMDGKKIILNHRCSSQGIISGPIRAYFETTRLCNLRCRACFNSSGKRLDDELSTQEAIDTLYALSLNGVMDVRFTGGEFTQRTDWEVLLDTSRKFNLMSSINTNGVFTDDFIVSKFLKYGVAQITTSIDGDKERHDYFRGKGSYDATVRSLRELKGTGIHIRLNSLIFRNNIVSLDSVVNIAEELCDEIDFYHPRPYGRGDNASELMLTSEELLPIYDVLANIANAHPGVKINYASREKKQKSLKIRSKLDELGIISDSSDGFTSINIGYNGLLWPSCYAEFTDKSLNLGNIKYDDLNNIWHHNEVLKEFRTKIQAQEREVISK